jgi:hypothetical protein
MIYLICKNKKKKLDRPPITTPSAFKEHPWETIVYFTAEKKWMARVAPGFVNGVDPRVPRAEDAARAAAKPGTAGADRPKYNMVGKLLSGTEIGLIDDKSAIELKESDTMDPRDPPIGYGSEGAGQGVPAFFYAMGVKKRDAVNVTTSNFDTFKFNLNTGTVPNPTFAKCELFLEQPRPSTKVSVDMPSNLVTGQLVDYSVGYDTTALSTLGARARVIVGPYTPVEEAATTFPYRRLASIGFVS